MNLSKIEDWFQLYQLHLLGCILWYSMWFNFSGACPVQNMSIFPVHLGILLWQVMIIMKYNTATESYVCINTEGGWSNYNILGLQYQLEMAQSQQIELSMLGFYTWGSLINQPFILWDAPSSGFSLISEFC